MTYKITKVVTERTADGRSVFVENGPPEVCTMAAMPGSEIINLWGTPDDGAVGGPASRTPRPTRSRSSRRRAAPGSWSCGSDPTPPLPRTT